MSYEQHCIDYAINGDPERDHWEHEEAARYDRFDGWGDIDSDWEYEYELAWDDDKRQQHVETLTNADYIDCREVSSYDG